GTGPVALGALAFATPTPPDPAGSLVVPAVLVGREAGGARWITTVGPPDDPAHDAPPEALLPGPGAARAAGPACFTGAAERYAADWCRAVARATEERRSGAADKVVLARAVRVVADRAFDPVAVLDRLRRSYPTCYLSAHRGFVGASP